MRRDRVLGRDRLVLDAGLGRGFLRGDFQARRNPALAALLAIGLLTSCASKVSPGPSGGAGGTVGGSVGGSPGTQPDASTSGDTAMPIDTGKPDTAPPPVDATTIVDLATPPADSGPTDARPISDASTSASRVTINFDVDWKFQQSDVAGADAKAFVDTAWAYVDLPHTPKFVTPEDPNAYAGVMWYRKHFVVPSAYLGTKIFIDFGAAMQLADVWVNGTHKVQHQGGYAPFTIDVTSDVAIGGADNVIAVRLDSNPNPAWPPGRTGVDFQYNGGLYRHVTMNVTNALHVTNAVYANKVASGGVFVTYTAVSATSATVNVKTNVINESTGSKSATVLSQLLDAVGAQVGMATSTVTINAGADADVSQSIVVASPKLWHPNNPYLYTLHTTVRDGATTVVDDLSTRIGIRTVQWTKAGGLAINGTQFKALGINMLEETYGLGNAISDQSIYFDVKRIREAGLTFIRGSHYPHAPAFYDACDALGVMVMDAQTGWQYFPAAGATTATAFINNSYQELRDMMRRDRNHPSIVAWEASLNESGYTDAWAVMANNIVHAEYPGAYSAAVGFNHHDIFIDATQHAVRSSTDPRPIIIDEYGDWDYGMGASGGVTSRQAREAGDNAMLQQVANIQQSQGLNQALPWFSADGYWEYADYGGYGGITRSGLLDMYRLPKMAYYFLQSQRDPNVTIPGVDTGAMVYIANQWTAASPTTVRVFSNCQQVSLFLNGTLVSTRAPDTTPTP
jgi:hypothetical protein